MLLSVGKDEEEAEALQAARDQLTALLPADKDLQVDRPNAFAPYFSLLGQIAPKAFARIRARQQELLTMAALPPELASSIAL